MFSSRLTLGRLSAGVGGGGLAVGAAVLEGGV